MGKFGIDEEMIAKSGSFFQLDHEKSPRFALIKQNYVFLIRANIYDGDFLVSIN